MGTPLITSYVYVGEKCYLVSTINRDSSAALGPGEYAETLVWEWCPKKRERVSDRILYQDGGSRDSIHTHINICQRLFVDDLLEKDTTP